MTDSQLPSDVYPESRNRLPLIKREELGPATQAIFDNLSKPNTESLVGLRGPGGIRLHSQKASEYTQTLNRYLRYETEFGGYVRELAILVTARAFDSQFEWAAHEPAALKEGISPEIIDIVKHNKPTDGLSGDDALIIDFTRQIHHDRRVTPEIFAQALERFGRAGLVDLVSLIGMYAATAILLCTFDMHLPDGQEPLLPVG